MDKWIKKNISDIKVGDICKRNPEWGPVLKSYCDKNIEINGWMEDEEFIVAEIRDYDYVRCDRPWEVYDDFDWSTLYDENNSNDKKMLDEIGRNGDKRDCIYFNINNMLWLSNESVRERELKKLLD